MFNLLIMSALCAITTIMANKKIAVFNDALRPIVLEYKEKRLSKTVLATTSFAFSVGYIIGFIPQSIAAGVIIIHVILLGTDIIGCSLRDIGKNAVIIAGVCGAIYGVILQFGLEKVKFLFEMLPYNFLADLGSVSSVVLIAFAIFPALVVSIQYGWKKGLLTFTATLLGQVLTARFGDLTLSTGMKVTINANAMALFIGMIFMIYYAVSDKRERGTSQQQLAALFAQRINGIRKYWYLFVLSGALIALAASQLLVTESALSAPLYQNGDFKSAALTEVARVIGFIPLVVTTGIATGIYSPAGIKMVFVFGSLGAAFGTPWLAFFVGGAWMLVEVFFLTKFSLIMDRFPGVRESGDHIRSAITKVLEIALLVGGVIAASAIAPSWGGLFVVGLYLLNETFTKKIVNLAIGPIGALLVGVIANILVLLNLMSPGS